MSRVLYEPGAGQVVPIQVWARSISDDTVRQLRRVASLPFVVERVAAMADAHVADRVSVGTVFATRDVVVPAALGGDLGCGMSAVRLDVAAEFLDRPTRNRIIGLLGQAIPAADAIRRGAGTTVPEELMVGSLSTRSLEHQRARAVCRQLGTLGGGNHFLELSASAEGGLWVLTHTGSRGIGGAIAAHHARAVGQAEGGDLVGVPVESERGHAFLGDLAWACEFSRCNRAIIALRAIEVIAEVLGMNVRKLEELDVPHNVVLRETWGGERLFVHRKGAIPALAGTMAVVPGSMGTASYIVEGLGNEASFGSCSHGAGRVMSRTEARKRVAPKQLAQRMRRIAWPEHLARSLVEEAPNAYRDIIEVLEDQADLVHRRIRLEPLVVLKG